MLLNYERQQNGGFKAFFDCYFRIEDHEQIFGGRYERSIDAIGSYKCQKCYLSQRKHWSSNANG